MARDSDLSAKRMHYEAKSSAYHSGNARDRRILRLVGGPNLRVLDVACGSGHIGVLLRAAGNTVAGCEISENAAREARKVLADVFVFDIEAAWPDVIRREAFDVVLLGE